MSRNVTKELPKPQPRSLTVRELAQLAHSDLCYCSYLINAYLEALDLDSEMEEQLLPRLLQLLDHLERAYRRLKGLENHYRKR